ncbi:hypothetical protein ACE1CI_22450 [Aerosakkonemataceae cyanobacterium BLCC-F50]|uniref:Uncharacterized protein n=1 Tax=Floridaenema flaviceps BLCC-F50 TaxID=3153642 RepID=A0ABV4XW66_9CYAN
MREHWQPISKKHEKAQRALYSLHYDRGILSRQEYDKLSHNAQATYQKLKSLGYRYDAVYGGWHKGDYVIL